SFSCLKHSSFNVFLFIQISYYAGAYILSDRMQFPSFFRTLPHGNVLAVSIVRILVHFSWTWVGILVEDTEFGELSIQDLKEELVMTNVCIGFSEKVPVIASIRKINHITDVIKKSTVNVIVIICYEAYLVPLMEEANKQNVTGKTWLATSSSAMSMNLFKNHLTGTIGITFPKSEIPGFREFLLDMHPSKSQHKMYLESFWEEIFDCKWPNANTDQKMAAKELGEEVKFCTGSEILSELDIPYLDVSELRVIFNIYNAVYTAVHALHDLYTCKPGAGPFGNGSCASIHHFEPWQLLHYVKHVHFKNQRGEEVFFDDEGNPPPVYEVINWHLTPDGNLKYVDVGRVDVSLPPGKELIINRSAIMWNGGQAQDPQSICSESCPPGYKRAAHRGEPLCCFDCIWCSEGEISNQTDSSDRQQCPHNHWSNDRRDKCIPKTIEFLSFKEPLGVILSCISIISSLIPAAILYTFVRYRDTPIVKGNNRELSYLLLLALMLCFLCCLIFIGQPMMVNCILRQTAFGIVFTFSVSCVLAKTIMVIIAFKATNPNSNLKKWLGPKLPNTIVFICTLFQVVICIAWLTSSPPFPEKNMNSKPGMIIIECNEGSTAAFWCMLGYMGLLAIVSFIVAFLAQNLPGSFNEAKFITFSMLVFVSIWLSFIPAYLSTKGKYMVAAEIFAMLASSAGLLSCIFFPKCYIIVLRPDINTRENLMGKVDFKNKK
uniref:G-protein coupled receptors family 3 profile domain-containing protein n=1 Tax=Latimeria chalumnae TaxID=7897 RepID=H2ZW88_LATCH